MSADEPPRATAAAARSQHTATALPRGRAALRQLLGPVLERIDGGVAATQALLVTADADAAAEVASVARQLGAERGLTVVAATSAARAVRLLRGRLAQVVAGPPAALVGAMRESALKLAGLRVVVLAWIDDTLTAGGGSDLEAVMAEVPKDAARVLAAARLTPEVATFAERYVRRMPRPTDPDVTEPALASPLRYVSVGAGGRPAALRRLLDDLDPAGVAIVVQSEDTEREVRHTLAELGYGPNDTLVQVTRAEADPAAALVVLYDLPPTRREVQAAVGSAQRQIVVLALARELSHARELAGVGGSPLILGGPGDRARGREDMLRGEVRSLLAAGVPARELLTLEPLLEEFDGIEVAAGLLRMLEQARTRGERAALVPRPRPPAVHTAGASHRSRDDRGSARESGAHRERGSSRAGTERVTHAPWSSSRPEDSGDRPRGAGRDRPRSDRPRSDRSERAGPPRRDRPSPRGEQIRPPRPRRDDGA